MPELKNHRADIVGRAMLCRRTTVFPVECVIRGYISGSAWKEYAAAGTLAGEKLGGRPGRKRKARPAIFSPATKAETGHDENITVARVREIFGDDVAEKLERMARTVYNSAKGSAATMASSSRIPSSSSAGTRMAASS